MDQVSRTSRTPGRRGSDAGFSLIEVLVSITVLAIGLISLAGVMALGVQRVAASSPSLIAREKAREAVESVHTARDNGLVTWNLIQNVEDGGVFVSGQQSIRLPGPDGLVGTADDTTIEKLRTPGNDGVLGNADDVQTPLNDYTRQIVITPLNRDGAAQINPNLRQITVNVRYKVQGTWFTYTLRTYISNFS